MFLLPRERSLIDLLAASADHVVAGTRLLPQALGGGPGAGAAVEELVGLERTADEGTHEIVRRINASLVLPFSRSDAYLLASALDDCLDHAAAAADLVARYHLEDLPSAAFDVVAVLQRQAELTAAAMRSLDRARDLADYWVEVNRLENHASTLYRGAVTALMTDEPDLRRVIALRDVLGRLKATADSFEVVAHRVELIAVEGT